jgi:hypothetical protein
VQHEGSAEKSAPESISEVNESTRPDAAGAPLADRSQTARGSELEAAIARITRALATADDDTIVELVRERKAMRAELEETLRPANVLPFKRGGT